MAKSSRIRITVPPMACLDVSPDTVFTATPSLFSLDDRVGVSWTRIVVSEVLESAAGVSSNETILDKNFRPISQQSAGIPVNSNLTIHVGNNVCLETFGLKARLTGDLKVAQDKQGLGLNRQINIPDGCFRTCG